MAKGYQQRDISLSELHPNKGQMPGVPANPRIIKDRKFRQLIESLKETPQMLELRELIVIPYVNVYVVLCGNMRLKALQELKAPKAPCKVLNHDTPDDVLRAIVVKDNIPFGEHDWDLIANEWDVDELTSWGLDIPHFSEPETVSFLAKPKGYEVTVECSDELDKAACIAMLTEKGYKAS